MSTDTRPATKKKGIIRRFFGSFFSVKKWVSYDELVVNAENFWALLKKLFSHKKKKIIEESYDGAMERMSLSEEYLVQRKRLFLKSAIIYYGFALILLIYGVYLLLNLKLIAALLTIIILTPIALTAYREHFWYMQMEKKQLGCTFNDWVGFVFRRK